MEEKNKKRICVPPAFANMPKMKLEHLSKEGQERVARIDKEFEKAFEFVKGHPKSVTILGSARLPEDNEHYIRARELAAKISNLGYTIVTGGGPGIMEAANRGAFENHNDSVGINIELPFEQILNPYINRSLGFHYFFSRKVALFFSAEAYIYFPGGFGTMDEFFELITLIETKKIEKVPVILVGKEYWGKLDEFIKEQFLEKNQTISPKDRDIYKIIDDDEEILEILKNAKMRDE